MPSNTSGVGKSYLYGGLVPKNYVEKIQMDAPINVEAYSPQRTSRVTPSALPEAGNFGAGQSNAISTGEPVGTSAMAIGKGLSNSSGIDFKGAPKDTTPESKAIADASDRQTKMQMGVAGAKFLIDVANANNAYKATSSQAQLNIMMARNQAADAIYRGHQAQFAQQSEGIKSGQSALLALAAQGQDVSGAAAGKVEGSLEAMGIMNGMQEEVNSMREALGFQLEEVGYNYQIANAGIARQNAYVGAGLELGATAAGALL